MKRLMQRLTALTSQFLEKSGRDTVLGHKGGEKQLPKAADAPTKRDSVRQCTDIGTFALPKSVRLSEPNPVESAYTVPTSV